MRQILTNQSTLEQVFEILKQSKDMQLKIITIESWNNVYQVLLKTKKGTKITSVDESKNKHQMFNNLEKILFFMLTYIYQLDLTQTPIFIVNTLANSIAEFVKILLPKPDTHPQKYLQEILSLIERNNNPQVYFVSLVIYDYILKDLMIDTHNFNFFVFKQMLLFFKENFLFKIVASTQQILTILGTSQDLTQTQSQEIIKIALQVFLDCLNFPYTISYSTYD